MLSVSIKNSLSFISAYLYNRKQKPKVGSEFSYFRNIFFGVPQGSILGPTYADDTTP